MNPPNALSLRDTLNYIAEDFGLNAHELFAYAQEDPFGGYDGDTGKSRDYIGSLWQVEGQILYALVRALKPQALLELGSFRGMSASHIALALKANNMGLLVCVDVKPIMDLLPEELRAWVHVVTQDGVEFVSQSANQWDFVFEDMGHETDQVAHVWNNVQIAKGGMLLSHDVCHHVVGQKVADGIAKSGKNAFAYLTQPSDCGLALWRNR